jgi:hypothetical protein
MRKCKVGVYREDLVDPDGEKWAHAVRSSSHALENKERAYANAFANRQPGSWNISDLNIQVLEENKRVIDGWDQWFADYFVTNPLMMKRAGTNDVSNR